MTILTSIVTFERQNLIAQETLDAVVATLEQSDSPPLRVLDAHIHSTGCLEGGTELEYDGPIDSYRCDPVGDVHQVVFALTLECGDTTARDVLSTVKSAVSAHEPLGLAITAF